MKTYMDDSRIENVSELLAFVKGLGKTEVRVGMGVFAGDISGETAVGVQLVAKRVTMVRKPKS